MWYRLIVSRAVALPRHAKRLVMMAADAAALPACLYLSGALTVTGSPPWSVLAAVTAAVTGVACMRMSGFYRSVVRFMGTELLFSAVRCIAGVAIVLLLCAVIFDFAVIPVRQIAVFWLMGVVYIVGSRTVAGCCSPFRERTGRSGTHLWCRRGGCSVGICDFWSRYLLCHGIY